jgi:hypothetical protein
MVFPAVLLIASVWLYASDPETTALERMPIDERQALYERTVRTLESTCSVMNRPEGLADFCRTQAEFVSKFPECDAACASLARKFLPQPTR